MAYRDNNDTLGGGRQAAMFLSIASISMQEVFDEHDAQHFSLRRKILIDSTPGIWRQRFTFHSSIIEFRMMATRIRARRAFTPISAYAFTDVKGRGDAARTI